MPDLVEDGLSDEQGSGEGGIGEEVELVEDCVGVWEDPGESWREGRRGREVGRWAEVVLSDNCRGGTGSV